MAENLLNDFVTGGPYIHSKAYHFRSDVGQRLKGQSGKRTLNVDLNDTIRRLTNMVQILRREADSFLADWGGDYKEASRDLFGGNKNNTKDQEYRRIFNKIINSRDFIRIVQRNRTFQKNSQLNQEVAQEVLGDYGKKIFEDILQNKGAVNIKDFVEGIVSNMVSRQKTSGKRIYVDGFEDIMKQLYEKTSQKYFQNVDTLRNSLNKAIAKKVSKVDWNKVYEEVKKEFLSYFPSDQQAEDLMDKIKWGFVKESHKTKSSEEANITGLALEGLNAVMLNNSNNLMLEGVFVTGDQDEDSLISFAESISRHFNVAANQISKMGHKNVSGEQSGTDWLLLNKRGKMVRAQAKNSINIVEELREESLNRPQSIHVQGKIKYNTFQENLKNYSVGKGGLTSEDWLFLDYLIANVLWIRAKRAVTKDAGGNYSSGVSGVQDLINDMLSREMGYFLGVTIDATNPLDYAQTIAGGSNVFFVIDGLLLYPTWMIIQALQRQVTAFGERIMNLRVHLGTDYTVPSKNEVNAAKENAKKGTYWEKGQPYGENLLAVGKKYGRDILNSLTISGVVMNIDIERILDEVYSDITFM